MQEITGEIGTATRKYGELLRSLECRLDAAQKKAEAAEAAAAEWKIKYETTSADMDGLQTQLDAVNRKNWELWYDLQDAQEDSKILLGYLENSIHARFQGAPGDSDHGWDNAGNLPLYSYEARLAARRLELPQPGHDRQSGLDATGDEESKEKIPAAFRRGAPNTKPAPEKEELPAQGSWDTSKGDRVSRKASGKDWEKGKPRR
ncbi:hypothetical protein C8A05DRAFT_36325 [Staphylotrichum tortipilum]|uniref:Uncharacterized protein n=1 Tax=Staphylotrichum tortipilum TaxID=2831512 RepID=A0AAN6RRQ4_9PEZI|nr:hypothetical protein C8A05DRAFT_36325 [Staphylotrichum longicolle]